jgi:hypothetical protein
MMRATVIAILVFFAGFSVCHGQLRDSSRNGIMLGLIYNADHQFNILFSYERVITKRTSVIVSAGMMPKKSVLAFPKWLTYHLSVEGQYYLGRNRDVTMSGFFVGPFLAYQESYVWYPESGKKAYRFYKPSYGVSFGFQRHLLERFRFMAGIKVGRHGKEIDEFWDMQGRLGYRNIWSSWWIGYANVKIGYSF